MLIDLFKLLIDIENDAETKAYIYLVNVHFMTNQFSLMKINEHVAFYRLSTENIGEEASCCENIFGTVQPLPWRLASAATKTRKKNQ